MQHKIIDIIAADSAAMMEYYFEGTLLHPEKNTTGYMLGKKYKLAACTVMNIRKGEIISQQTYFDQVSFLRQVGFFDQQQGYNNHGFFFVLATTENRIRKALIKLLHNRYLDCILPLCKDKNC